jgi:hypothetical protein
MKRKIAFAIFAVGLLVTAYGAAAFWLFRNLPPNNPVSGRLPCSYLMFTGMATMVVALIIRDFRISNRVQK